MKRFVSIVLSLALMTCLFPSAFAASDEAVEAAQTLYELGLFNGTGTNTDGTPNFDLDRTPTRQETITMLVRLLGKDEEAKAGTWETPFIDVADWAKPYVGYAYENRLTSGTSETTFGGDLKIELNQYMTFILRALGYQDKIDFTWDDPWPVVKQLPIGSVDGWSLSSNSSISKLFGREFNRGDVATISHNALYTRLKDSTVTLGETLAKIKMLDISTENLRGIWQRKDNNGVVEEELIVEDNTIIHMIKYEHPSRLLTYTTGTFYLDGNLGVAKWDNGSANYRYQPNVNKDITLDTTNDEQINTRFYWVTDSMLCTTWLGIYQYWTKVEKSELYDECHKLVDDYRNELSSAERETIAQKMQAALKNQITADTSAQSALVYDGQLILGSLGGLSSSTRYEAQERMQANEMAIKASCSLIKADIEEVRAIFEKKAGTESLIRALNSLENVYDKICSMDVNTDHDNLMDMCDLVEAASEALTEISKIILETYLKE